VSGWWLLAPVGVALVMALWPDWAPRLRGRPRVKRIEDPFDCWVIAWPDGTDTLIWKARGKRDR
jgi:hypothetical protein